MRHIDKQHTDFINRKLPGTASEKQHPIKRRLFKLNPILDNNNVQAIQSRQILAYFFLGLTVALLSDMPESMGVIFHACRGVLILMLIFCILCPIRPAITILLTMAIASRDIVNADTMATSLQSTASVWQLYAGPFKPGWIIFSCLAVQLFKVPLTLPKQILVTLLWFATVPIATGWLYNGFTTNHATTQVIIDLKFPLMLITGITVYYSTLKKYPDWLPEIMAVFIGVIISRCLVDIIYFGFSYGPLLGERTRVSLDTTKGVIVYLVFLAGTIILVQKRYLSGFLLGTGAALLLAVYGTRMLWITCLLGGPILFTILGTRKAIAASMIASLLAIGGIGVLTLVDPVSAKDIYNRSQTLTQGRAPRNFAVPVESNIISRIDPIRYAEILNVMDTSNERLSWLLGNGYGGFYHDKVIPYPAELKNSYPQYSLDSGLYYRAHNFILHLFFKHGLIGLMIISALWAIPTIQVTRIFRRKYSRNIRKQPLLNASMIALAAFAVTAAFQLYWSGKGLLINGMVIAACMDYARKYHHELLKTPEHGRPIGFRHPWKNNKRPPSPAQRLGRQDLFSGHITKETSKAPL